MDYFLERQTNTISLSEFYENHLLNKYNYEPPGQRKSVWNDRKKSFLIDSILKNFPIPPIFLRRNVNSKGRTTYDVIDGRQRLESIVHFIENKIPLPDDFGSDEYGMEELNGQYFDALDQYDIKRHFWNYPIPVEYISTNLESTIDYIFDRLNRNGEPLTPQELRNARYHRTSLLSTIKELSMIPFWHEMLKDLETHRMEDLDFVSELFFTIVEGQIFESTQKIIDGLYEKWSGTDFSLDENKSYVEDFKKITHYLKSLNLDYKHFRISGVSHLYGLWCFAEYCVKYSIPKKRVTSRLVQMFTSLRERKYQDENIKKYRKSMDSNTKSKGARTIRLEALKEYCL